MLLILGSMMLGVIPGFLLRNNATVVHAVGRFSEWIVYVLLFTLGAGLGGNDALFAQLPVLGGRGVLIGFCSLMGSVLAVRFFVRAPSSASEPDSQTAAQATGPTEAGEKPTKSDADHSVWPALRGSLRIMLIFVVGMALARLHFLPIVMTDGSLMNPVLVLMMLSVGMGLGFDVRSFGVLREMRGQALLVPTFIVLGSFAGAAVSLLFLPDMHLRETAAVGLGLGYYSLVSVMVTEMAGPSLGSVTLLANIFREVFTIMAAPLLAALFGPLAPTASGAAPAMDTCLPAIVRYTGERCGVLAVFSGIALTVVVPFIVSAVLHWL